MNVSALNVKCHGFRGHTRLSISIQRLKAPERIAFKYAVLVYKCLHGSAPPYLTYELCQVAE